MKWHEQYENIIKVYKPWHVILGFTYTIKEKMQTHDGAFKNMNLEPILSFYFLLFFIIFMK